MSNNQIMVDSIHASYFRKLEQLCGYVQNSSEQIVIISQDDATRNFVITVKGYGVGSDAAKRIYTGDSLQSAIQAAWEEECEDGE